MNAEKLVFIDDAGVSVAMSFSTGWAPPGEVPVIERPIRGGSLNLIGAIGVSGPIAMKRVEGSVNGEEFVGFLRDVPGPHHREGDIVVMDGPRIHRVAGVAEALAQRGATPLSLPAYSPELNPIEMARAWIKRLLRKAALRQFKPLVEKIHEVWAEISADLCAAWVRHCNYPVPST